MTDGDKPASQDRPLWSLSRDEQRILAITFVGGLASIILAAGIIGAAIALGRWFRHQNLEGGFAHWLPAATSVLALL
jgi:hypothetical protein